jgi:RNA polymerase sigma-70 factor, ECF subfamily
MATSDRPYPDKTGGWFDRQVADAQSALYAYACTLMAGSTDAWDVLQDANVVMWQKAAEVSSPADFMPWAYTVVRYQVMAHRKRMSRERHVFSLSVLEGLAEHAAVLNTDFEVQVAALEDCRRDLPEQQREYLLLRYIDGMAVKDIARRVNRTENAVAATLYRARLALAKCVEAKMASGGAS